jgi:hypothetical protein
MVWQYRVMKIDGQYAIHEVHYDDELLALSSYSAVPTYPRGEDFGDLAADLILYQEALSLPALTPEDFP